MSTANVFSVEVKNAPEVPGEGKPRRHPLVADADQLPVFYNPEVRTLYENFQLGLKASGSKPFMGFRPFDAEGKAGPYSWITYDEAWARIKNVGAAIVASDLQANDCVGIFSPNRVEWVVAAEACNAYSFVSVPLYDTLGKEAIQHIVNETKLKLIFVVKEKAKALVEIIGSLPSLKTVVFINGDAPELREKLVAASIAVHTFEEFETLGQGKPVDVRPPAHTDIATICYTSGTTGLPKGAVILHQNLICGAGSAVQLGDNGYFRKFTSEDVHISYLPLAHMLERIVLTFLIGLGARLGFYQGDPTKLVDDLGALKPTLFISVPRILNRVHDRIWATVKAAGGVKRMLFETALNAKKEGLKQGHLTHWLWDRLVFNKIRDRLGGNVKAILTGSAPIAPDVLDFLRVCFSCDVYEGYGQTENCAIASIANLGDYTSGHVGSMYPCVEIKLVDVPDMNYTSKDVPHPRGEICTRGANNFKEYYLSPDKTAETMDADGWLHSGDIGMWDEQGRLKIIDRKKNIFKLAQGEYIAPEKIENILVKNDYVAQIFVHGDSLQAELVAIVIPDEEPLLAWIKAQGIENITTLEQAVKLDQVKKLILEQLNASGKAGGLKGFEMVRAVHLEHVPFTVENDFLTPTQKLKRPVAAKHYAAQIAEMYAALNKAAAEKPEK